MKTDNRTARNMANASWQFVHNYLDNIGLVLNKALAVEILNGLQKKDPYYSVLYEILKNDIL